MANILFLRLPGPYDACSCLGCIPEDTALCAPIGTGGSAGMGVPPISEFLTLPVLPGVVPGASIAVEGGRCRRCFGGGSFFLL